MDSFDAAHNSSKFADKVANVDSESPWLAELAGSQTRSRAPEPIAADSSLIQIKSALTNNKAPMDYSLLFQNGEKVAFFGERHDDLGEKDDVISNLRFMRDNNGLTHVALEMLNDADMPSVKAYCAGDGSRESVLDRLKQRWSIAPGVPEKYMEMIDAIKGLHLTPLALDEVEDGRDDHGGSLYETRNEHWAKVLNDTISAEANSKILVYSGRDHIGFDSARDNTNEILKDEYGITSTVLAFASKLDPENSLLGKIAREAKSKNTEEIALKLKPGVNRPADYIIFPPQT